MESERIPMRKVWNHAIDLKETFKPKKGRIYLLSKDEREEVQKFVNDQLRKGYIRPSKFPQISLVYFTPVALIEDAIRVEILFLRWLFTI